nr:immunoglobulin heavy chain junction region [Macaca mulatta]MOV91633.1 immunoglobulin heavy chain junction region [Macaca mulatta]MOV92101.1 immunoglobulin heavy chain junction region [Macaca mulatta]
CVRLGSSSWAFDFW